MLPVRLTAALRFSLSLPSTKSPFKSKLPCQLCTTSASCDTICQFVCKLSSSEEVRNLAARAEIEEGLDTIFVCVRREIGNQGQLWSVHARRLLWQEINEVKNAEYDLWGVFKTSQVKFSENLPVFLVRIIFLPSLGGVSKHSNHLPAPGQLSLHTTSFYSAILANLLLNNTTGRKIAARPRTSK